MVETSKPPRSPRTSTTSLPLVAAISSRRCDSAKIRRWIAQASRVSAGINTERRSASGLSRPASSIAVTLFLPDDLGAKFPQFRLDGARVRRTHADQQLLSGRATFEVSVGVFVEDLGLHQLDRRRHLRRLQQLIDHLDQPIVEVLARIAQVLVSLLEQRIQPLVHQGECLHVRGLQHSRSEEHTSELQSPYDLVCRLLLEKKKKGLLLYVLIFNTCLNCSVT